MGHQEEYTARMVSMPCTMLTRIVTKHCNTNIGRRLLSTSTNLSKQAQVDHTSNWSYVCGPGTPPLMGITIGQGVDIAADTFGDREGLVVSQQGIRRNFTQLKQEIDMLAAVSLSLVLCLVTDLVSGVLTTMS